MEAKEITFKATKRTARSHAGYRQIEKGGNLEIDSASLSDDVIFVSPETISAALGLERVAILGVIVDCDKKTGGFSLKISYDGKSI